MENILLFGFGFMVFLISTGATVAGIVFERWEEHGAGASADAEKENLDARPIHLVNKKEAV